MAIPTEVSSIKLANREIKQIKFNNRLYYNKDNPTASHVINEVKGFISSNEIINDYSKLGVMFMEILNMDSSGIIQIPPLTSESTVGSIIWGDGIKETVDLSETNTHTYERGE